ncbi:hypothetical protein [Legionella sainthelensi]|uniref:hypothetical protein n=1 Tax=Legionella sainthelensi TaxID=28087 RepID=UPI001FD57AD7|nr:hypothetical protein [Legionella sainthelensi]
MPDKVVSSSGKLCHIEDALSDVPRQDRQSRLGLRYAYNTRDIVNYMDLLSKQQTLKESLSEIKTLGEPNKTTEQIKFSNN